MTQGIEAVMADALGLNLLTTNSVGHSLLQTQVLRNAFQNDLNSVAGKNLNALPAAPATNVPAVSAHFFTDGPYSRQFFDYVNSLNQVPAVDNSLKAKLDPYLSAALDMQDHLVRRQYKFTIINSLVSSIKETGQRLTQA